MRPVLVLVLVLVLGLGLGLGLGLVLRLGLVLGLVLGLGLGLGLGPSAERGARAGSGQTLPLPLEDGATREPRQTRELLLQSAGRSGPFFRQTWARQTQSCLCAFPPSPAPPPAPAQLRPFRGPPIALIGLCPSLRACARPLCRDRNGGKGQALDLSRGVLDN